MSKPKAIGDLIESIDNIDVDSLLLEDRTKLRNASTRWLAKSSTPWDLWFRLGWTQLETLSATKVCLDIKLFEAWKQNGGGHKTASELASISEPKCDTVLMERLMRLLASAGIVSSVEGHKYALAPFSKSFEGPAGHAAANFAFKAVLPLFRNLPEFLKSTGYKNPEDVTTSNFTSAFNYKGTLFDFAANNPEFAQDFNLMVTWIHSIEFPWTEIFPTETLLSGNGEASGDPILVDVGGGLGDAVRHFAQKHKVSRNSLVLQDFQPVLDQAQIEDVAVAMEVDFFKPQPVKGASAYLLSHVLHDWPDDMARTILSNIKSAMVPGKSKILLYEIVLRDDPSDTFGPSMDLLMMAALSASERTLDMWKAIIEPVGLKITTTHFKPPASHAVIEVEIDESAS